MTPLQKQAVEFKRKCLTRLSRNQGEFFLDLSTNKDLSLFWHLVTLKKHAFVNDVAAGVAMARYLQILMILSNPSNDPRDKRLASNYFAVPFDCELIIRGKDPIADEHLIDEIFKSIARSYPLEAYWNDGRLETEAFLAATPPSLAPMVNFLLEYYSTPFVGIAAILGVKPGDFHFLRELQDILAYVYGENFRDRDDLTLEERQLIEALQFVATHAPVRAAA
jgi:hypothetical protein